MNKQQLKQKVLGEIKKRQEFANSQANNNLLLAFKDAEFKANYSNIKEVECEISKAEVFGLDTKMQTELLQILKKERAKLLVKLNLKESDFVPHYTCKQCSDTGLFNGQFCKCYNLLMHKNLNKMLGTILNEEHTFENSNMKLFSENKDAQKIYDISKEWCQKYPNSKYKNLTFTGKTGVGKSYLIECIANNLISKKALVQFLTAFNLNNAFLNYHTSFDASKQTYLSPILDCDILLIDDLGTEPILKNVTCEYLYLILNERLVLNKSTIITTNLTPTQILTRYGERIFSRLSNKQNSLIISFPGNDLRLKK